MRDVSSFFEAATHVIGSTIVGVTLLLFVLSGLADAIAFGAAVLRMACRVIRNRAEDVVNESGALWAELRLLTRVFRRRREHLTTDDGSASMERRNRRGDNHGDHRDA